MKCGAALVTRTTVIPPEHIPAALLKDAKQHMLTRQVCSAPGCDWVS
jgi:hypothetical protein